MIATMNGSERVIAVLRAVALLGGAAAAVACNRGATGATTGGRASNASASIEGTACGAVSAREGASCEGHQLGHECEWHGMIRCTCVQQADGPKWSRCLSRAVPGPLPPPELSA
jgi:hypothetical protein